MVIVPLHAGGLWLGVDASCVVEVLPRREAAALVGASALVRGIIPWRSRAIAVVDPGAWAGSTCNGSPDYRRLLVVAWDDFVIALGADAVREAQQGEVDGDYADCGGARLKMLALDELGRLLVALPS